MNKKLTQDMVDKKETFCKKTCKMSFFTYFAGRAGACQMRESRLEYHKSGE